MLFYFKIIFDNNDDDDNNNNDFDYDFQTAFISTTVKFLRCFVLFSENMSTHVSRN